MDYIFGSIFREIGSIMGFVGAGVVGYFVPKASAKIKSYMQQKWFNASLKRSIELKVKLAELKGELNAERIYLTQFHNGKVFLGDNQFHKFYMSAIFEITSSGLSREMQNMQNIPLSSIAELIYKMQNDNMDMILVGDYRGCDISFEDADLDDFKYMINPEAVLYVKVKNKGGMFIGLLTVCFNQEILKSKLQGDLAKSEHMDAVLAFIKNQI